MKCPLCGYEFEVEEVTRSCKSCLVSKACKKTCCPNCRYEVPLKSGIVRFFQKRRIKK